MQRVILILMASTKDIFIIFLIGFIFQMIFFPNRKVWKKAIYILFSFYIIVLLSAVGIPDIYSLTFDPTFNVFPIIDIFNSPIDYIKNEVLNIILFIPLGFFLPIMWYHTFHSAKSVAIFSMGVSVAIEISQIFTFRLTDIDDLITNVLGGIIGFLIVKAFLKKSLENSAGSDGKISEEMEVIILLLYSTSIKFFLPV